MNTLFSENRCKMKSSRPQKRDWVSSALSYYLNNTSMYLPYGIYSLVLTLAPPLFHLWVWFASAPTLVWNWILRHWISKGAHVCSGCSREALWPGWPRCGIILTWIFPRSNLWLVFVLHGRLFSEVFRFAIQYWKIMKTLF